MSRTRRPCRTRTARPNRRRPCLPGRRRRRPRTRCPRSDRRPTSPWRRAGPASFAFRYCSWNPMFRLLSEIHLQMLTPPMVGSVGKTDPVRTLHMSGRRQTSISDSFPSSTCYSTTVSGVSGWTFSRKARIRKRDPEGSLKKQQSERLIESVIDVISQRAAVGCAAESFADRNEVGRAASGTTTRRRTARIRGRIRLLGSRIRGRVRLLRI